MNSRAIIMPFHMYTPFGREFYEPILDFQFKTFEKYKDEFDKVYLLDSNWQIGTRVLPDKVTYLITDPSLRYYDAYKSVLPDIKEDLILFLDDDLVIYKEGVINNTFHLIDKDMAWVNEGHVGEPGPLLGTYDVVSIIDTIGTMQVPLKTGNKFCPYWFATRTELLKKYLDIDWSPDAMPYTETFGLLTEAMLKDGLKAYEMEDDKTDNADKDLGYYHIRSGSTPAYLLATKHYGNIDTYWEYLKNQPRDEIIRHCEWYDYMGGNSEEIRKDLE